MAGDWTITVRQQTTDQTAALFVWKVINWTTNRLRLQLIRQYPEVISCQQL